MTRQKIIAIVIIAMCVALTAGYFVYQNSIRKGKDGGIPEKENKLIVAKITYNGVLGIWSLTSIYQDKYVYHVAFKKNQRVTGEEYLIYAENTTNNLSISKVSSLFSVSNITSDYSYTYTVFFSDKSFLNDAEFQTLLETINYSAFQMLNDSYIDNDLLDGIDTYLIINLSGVIKIVHEYGSSAPAIFHEITAGIENIENRRWCK